MSFCGSHLVGCDTKIKDWLLLGSRKQKTEEKSVIDVNLHECHDNYILVGVMPPLLKTMEKTSKSKM